MPMPVPSHNGMIDPDELRASIRKRNLHHPIPRLLCLENTHNRGSGRVQPYDIVESICDWAHEKGRFWQVVPREMLDRLEHPVTLETAAAAGE